MGNKIRQAYEQGLRIRTKEWKNPYWIKKHSETHSIDEIGDFWTSDYWDFETNPNNWEIYHEDIHLFEETPNTLPDTLIINGIKYKRDDN